MGLESDLTVNVPKFKPENVSGATDKFNGILMEIMKNGPKWYEVGAAKYRQMRLNGETPLPKPVFLPNAKTMKIPSRENGRMLPARYFLPDDGQVKGVYYHIHGGGWVLQSEDSQDPMLNRLAQASGCCVVSVGYRLAPEDPFPAGVEDCYDAGEYLVDNAQSLFGAPLLFMGGESAGGHLSALTAFHLIKARPSFSFAGLVLNFGCYDLSMLPQAYTFKKPEVLVLDLDIMEKYLEVYLPGMPVEKRKDPAISPLYADMTKMKLPSALLTCGTQDPLLDDTIYMSAKWQMAGGEAIVKIYPGAPHGFIMFPPDQVEISKKGMNDILTYLKSKMA